MTENQQPPSYHKSPNPSRRETQTAHAISEAMGLHLRGYDHVPEWLPGLIFGLRDPHIAGKFRENLQLLSNIVHFPRGNPSEMTTGQHPWDGSVIAGALVHRALAHARVLRETRPLRFTRELEAELESVVRGAGDPSGGPEKAEPWQRMATAINWARVARDYLENEEPTPENARAVELAQLAMECLHWAKDTVDLETEQRRNQPGAKQRGRKLYYERIHDECGASRGQFVVIDVTTGEYEVDDDRRTALHRLIDRRPQALVWTEMQGRPDPFVNRDLSWRVPR